MQAYRDFNLFAAFLDFVLLVEQKLTKFIRIGHGMILTNLLKPCFKSLASFNDLWCRQRKNPLRGEIGQAWVLVARPLEL